MLFADDIVLYCTKIEEVEKKLKGALYRIWCGVNGLGDSGVKVV